ncbi:MAG: NUDIX hydrolase [Candidatus Aenigmarchaeota archaeon]|nr:NUDIX hydrolase [Candidatus Aenigmarchaeota archaeon]
MKYIIASGPVIVEEQKDAKGVKQLKVLLDKHGKDEFWKFPGGIINKGESLEQCAKNRVKEELGIGVDLIRPLKPMIIWKRNEVVILIHYLAKRKGEIKPGRHVREWAWLPIKKLPKDVGPNISTVLKEIKV